MNKLTALIEAANAATPGPWTCEKFNTNSPTLYHNIKGNYSYKPAWVEPIHVCITKQDTEWPDADFIALANPATILELCALLEKAEEALQACDDELVHGASYTISHALAAIKQWKEK